MRVVFVATYVTRYRVDFHEAVRKELAARGIEYVVLSGRPSAREATKGDAGHLSWAIPVPTRYIFGAGILVWQNVFTKIRRGDLVVLMQQNRCLSNYIVQVTSRLLGIRVALFGHGKNFQETRDTVAERWKRIWARRCDWWFAYTEKSAELVRSYGFPAGRITVFQNAIDTTGLRQDVDAVSDLDLQEFRKSQGLAGCTVGIYMGGLYEEKRPDFLLAAADRIHDQARDFRLIVVGDGPARLIVEQAAASRPWIRYLGKRYGREKALALRAADLFLLPGAVGLAVLDAAVAGLPMITTSFPLHGPEIAYLEDGHTGVIVEDWNSVDHYAQAVLEVITSPARRMQMSANARAGSASYTVEEMARRFALGAISALNGESRQLSAVRARR